MTDQIPAGDHLIPPGAVEEFVALRGGFVRVLRSANPARGDAPPLVLLHGAGNDSAAISWYHAWRQFGARCGVIAFDMPGFGLTQGIEPTGDPKQMADLTAEMLDALGLPKAVVVGFSMGGDVALNLALRHAERVGALILVAPGGLVPMFQNPWSHAMAWMASTVPASVAASIGSMAEDCYEDGYRYVMKHHEDLEPEIADEYAREARTHALMGQTRYNQATVGVLGMRNNNMPHVHTIAIPTLFLHGVDDPIVPRRASERAAEEMPDARYVEVPGCGHWVQLEFPEVFEREVGGFLDDLRTAAPPA